MAEVAENVRVLPLQIGPLLDTVGVAGGEGSVRVKGPTIFEEQLPSCTLIFE